MEIEFAGITVRDAAHLTRRHFGGTLREEGAHRLTLEDTDFGSFTIELDAQLVHANDSADKAPSIAKDIDARAREALGHAVSGLVPVEIVAPPIPWDQLAVLTPLFETLRRSGAQGTQASPLFGFGLHLNPEVAEQSAEYARRHLQAYVILADWLRDAISIDTTRRLLPHIDPFPKAYVQHILQPGYAPDLQTLIRDYVRHNPTRNRELDMTVLFRHLDEATLVSLLDDVDLIKPRPTFHYRLPNASLDDPTWNAVVEWNRWVQVEELAADEALLARRAEAYVDYLNQPLAQRWLDTLNAWFES